MHATGRVPNFPTHVQRRRMLMERKETSRGRRAPGEAVQQRTMRAI